MDYKTVALLQGLKKKIAKEVEQSNIKFYDLIEQIEEQKKSTLQETQTLIKISKYTNEAYEEVEKLQNYLVKLLELERMVEEVSFNLMDLSEKLTK